MATNQWFTSYQKKEVLTKEQVYDYVEKYKAGDINARNMIIEHNIGLAISVAKKYFYKTPFDKADLIEIGLLQLLEQLHRFDPTRNMEFSTWAETVMRYAMDHYIVTSTRYQRRFKNSLDEIKEANSDYTLEELKIEENHYYYEKSNLYNSELEENTEIVSFLPHEMYGLTLKDLLYDPTADFTTYQEDTELDQQVLPIFYECFKSFSSREQQIVTLYFGLYGNLPHTYREVGELLSISRTIVYRTVNRVLQKVKIEIKKQKLYDISFQKMYK